MIDGIKLDVSSEELKKRVLERSGYHQQKTDWYSKKADELEPAKGELEGSTNAFSQLKEKRDSHKTRTEFFQFLADHIIPNEVYRLQSEDLVKLEFISRYF